MINMPHISMLFVAIGGLLLICLVMLIIILRLRQEHQHLKAEIAKTHDNLEQIIAARTLMLRQAGQAVSESIDYASKLQRGLLPSLDALEDAFGKVTVFWQPKDVVGGDFYWSGQMGTARVLVVMDCTGHGVPGAFMTIIAHSAMEQICATHNASHSLGKQPPHPATILNELHHRIIALLHKDHDRPTQDRQTLNGLDAAVVVLPQQADTLAFAGAMMDFYVVSPDGPAKRYQGNRISLGYGKKHLPALKTITLPITSGHSYVLATDGLLSQPGHERGFGFGYRRLTAHLTAAATEMPVEADTKGPGNTSPSHLGKIIMRALRQWQGKQTRRDDVTVMIFQPKP
jgi:serine phosphatase RsbU (regulator of sigma subunit)